jgi:hypothetical protein
MSFRIFLSEIVSDISEKSSFTMIILRFYHNNFLWVLRKGLSDFILSWRGLCGRNFEELRLAKTSNCVGLI